jgi:transcriptional regulator with XRE-family HTH domain
MTSPETIGQRIKRERLAMNMTQRELAARVEVGVPHISKIEADRESPSDELVARVASVFGLQSEELLLVARRLPDEVFDTLASDPPAALAFLRSFDPSKKTRGK